MAGVGLASYGFSLWKVVSGTPMLVTYADPFVISSASIHQIELRLDGSSIEVWWDGLRYLEANDAFAATATKYGLWWSTVYDGSSTFGCVPNLVEKAKWRNLLLTKANRR
jgi:hypothetical protein